jgi:hypothetical protein
MLPRWRTDDGAAGRLGTTATASLQRVQHARNLSGGERVPGTQVARMDYPWATLHLPACRLKGQFKGQFVLLTHRARGIAFDDAHERERAGWTNEIPYPIRAEITSRSWMIAGEKGLCSKDLRRFRLLMEPFLFE